MDPFTTAQNALLDDLGGQVSEVEVDSRYPENGSFVKRHRNDHDYWYYIGYRTTAGGEAAAKQYSRYAGDDRDPETRALVDSFKRLKARYRDRKALVKALKALKTPGPPAMVGEIAEALWKGGIFEQGCVLTGTSAYAAYSGALRVRIPAEDRTGGIPERGLGLVFPRHADLLLDPLRWVDPTFEMQGADPLEEGIRFLNAAGFEVVAESTTLGEDNTSKARAETNAFLAEGAQSTVMVHKAGVPVSVPEPGRFCVRDLVSPGRSFARTSALIEAAAVAGRKNEIGRAWIEAWIHHPHWRPFLLGADREITSPARTILRQAREEAFRGCTPEERELAHAEAPPIGGRRTESDRKKAYETIV